LRCHPISYQSRHELLQLRQRCHERGDDCVAILLTGVDLYISIEKEFEPLEMMRDYADHMREAIEKTPSASELEELYHWNPEKEQE
jgi:hypothetical protein